MAALGALIGCGGSDAPAGERDPAISAAMDAYDQAKAKGVDFTDGPCIAESLPGLDDWVADVAHDPRTDVDDQASNQCRRYRDGQASHFVELTPEGELIRAE
ncbi:MAG: hypothetical protein ACJ75R_03500 [Solirubrobacterales bacterium]